MSEVAGGREWVALRGDPPTHHRELADAREFQPSAAGDGVREMVGAESRVSRRADIAMPLREPAVGQPPHSVDTSTRLRELADGLVRLGFPKTVSKQRINEAYDALAGKSPTDEDIVMQALRNR